MKLVDCRELKDLAFTLETRVRYFGYMDNRQGMMMSELRNKEEDHPGESQLVRDLTFFKAAMASWSLYFGRVRYAVVSHDLFMIVMIPVEGGLVIVTTDSSTPLEFVNSLEAAVRKRTLREEVVSGKV